MRVFITVLLLLCAAQSLADNCLGEYQQCPNGACVLYAPDCGICASGQFLCPDRTTCVDNAASYVTCPGLKGTHLDWTMSLQARLDYLANHTTLSEQIMQLQNEGPALPDLGIPAYNWLNDDEHGVKQPHATDFPNGCNLGASWDKDLLHAVGLAVGMEARGGHNGFVHAGNRGMPVPDNGVGITLYAPNLNLVRDPRWGRSQEVWSEDPYLTSRMVIEFVTGIQTSNGDYRQAIACCKHYAAYDIEDIPVSRFVFDAQVNTRTMWETFLPSFDACINDAKGQSVMCSYNSINGVPTCGDKDLLNGILREQWGFEGFVVSDYDAWANIYLTHKYCESFECAASVGIKAGLDQEGGGTLAIDSLGAAVSAGNVTTDDVATSFKRLFRTRIQLGMLDPPTMNPFNYYNNSSQYVLSPAHLQLARQAAREGICMYKNDNNVLPLDASTIGNIAVVGWSADQTGLLHGNYAVTPTVGMVSVLDGIASALNNAMPNPPQPNCTFYPETDFYQPNQVGVLVNSATECCEKCSLDPTCLYFTFWEGACYKKTTNTGRRTSAGRTSGNCYTKKAPVTYSQGCDTIFCTSTAGFPAAAAASAAADATVVVLGLDQQIEAEFHDRTTIALPAGQYALVKALRAASDKPIIAVLVHGGTLELGPILDDVDAILDAWYPGMEGGNAVADVLFGDYNPAGRTAVTYYQSDAQLPPMGTMDPYAGNGSHGLTYRFFDEQPQFPFGFGLSYTTFAYSSMKVNGTSFAPCDEIGVTVDVTNNGTVDGDEVIQLYVKQPEATMPCPNVRLVDFARVTIKAGQTVTVQLTILPKFHAVVPITSDVYNGQQIVEAGKIDLFVGGGQPDFYEGTLQSTVEIVGQKDVRTC